ncbi:unnamed protein product [Somion occarium]|uniref:HMG box domain-containing protein n=1 Tax=Somion occarium TaxID=3059160 RepID=A0ABP1CTE3_9APHY
MPALRTRRRRSSIALGLASLTPAKPGNYGINTSPRNVSFAPNVTPSTYVETEETAEGDGTEPTSPADALFPPVEAPVPPPTRRRVPPGKRRSQGYIPRPPNAFMLFRADFVRQKHVPGSIETNHGSLSKIIGNCWRQLPLEEKRIWESRAKKAKADHRERYPNYRFRPVHNKHKKRDAARKEKTPMPVQDERRCEEVAQLLLEGKKGDELAAAVRMLDYDRAHEMSMSATASPMLHMPAPLPMVSGAMPFYTQRRSSSVPPMMYHPINIPSVPFLMHSQAQHPTYSRPESPVSSIARSNRMFLGQRRASSVGVSLERSWMMGSEYMPYQLQQDDEPLPEVDTSLFEQSFLDSSSGFSMSQPNNNLFVQTNQVQHPEFALSISPLDPLSSTTTVPSSQSSAFPFYSPATAPNQPHQYGGEHMSWLPALEASSGPSSAFSGSPSPSEQALPAPPNSTIHTPQPQHPIGYAQQQHDMHALVGPSEPEFTFEQLQEYGFDTYASGTAMYGAESQHCGLEAGVTELYPYHEYPVEVPQY